MVDLAELNLDLVDTAPKFRVTSMSPRQAVANRGSCWLHLGSAPETRARLAVFVRNRFSSARARRRKQAELPRWQNLQTVRPPTRPGNVNRHRTGLLPGRPERRRWFPLCVEVRD